MSPPDCCHFTVTVSPSSLKLIGDGDLRAKLRVANSRQVEGGLLDLGVRLAHAEE